MSFVILSLLLVYCIEVFYFFFFKQKTAYEMRISDWSSDVCSSDLRGLGFARRFAVAVGADPGRLDRGGRGPFAQAARRSGRARARDHGPGEIGRASCRERVCQYV